MSQIVLFILVQLFSFSSSEDQFICAVKRFDKFMDAQNPPAGIESALGFGFWACVSTDSLSCCVPPSFQTVGAALFSLLTPEGFMLLPILTAIVGLAA